MDEDKLARKQMAYTVLYLYAVEKAGGDAAMSSELRALRDEKKCYQQDTSTAVSAPAPPLLAGDTSTGATP